MKKCKYFEDLMFDANTLDAGTRRELEAHLQACSHCRKVFDENRAIFAVLQAEVNTMHVDARELERYADYLLTPDEPDFSGEFLSLKELEQIRAHVSSCQKCEKHVDEMLQELRALDVYLADAGIPNIIVGERAIETTLGDAKARPRTLAGERSALVNFWQKLMTVLTAKPYLIPAAGVAIIALLVMIHPFSGNDIGYAGLAALDQPRFSYLTRGNRNHDLQSGLQSLNNASYDNAIHHIERFLAANPESENVAYARYLCGVAYLYAAKESGANAQLSLAISNLKETASTTKNLRIKEGAAWYLGKAFLIKKDARQAKLYFQQVIQLRGRKHQAAKKILARLEKILTK